MREINSCEDLQACCGNNMLCMWAAQGLDGYSYAWASEDRRAVAIAGPALSSRDRLAVWGASDAAVPLVRRVLAKVGPTYRPLGDSALIDALVHGIPTLNHVGSFGWMDCTSPAGCSVPGPSRAEWLPETTLPEVETLVEASFPASYAKPGVPGVERWAGVRDDGGRLAAVGALAWSAPTVGFLAGIAVQLQTRSQGLGRQVCNFLLPEALRLHGAAALMVNDWNHAALRLYLGMGLRYRPLRAASVST